MTPPMPDRWPILSPHLDRALEMNEQERATWLQTLHESDPTLAAELGTLLEEHRALARARFLEDDAPRPANASLAGQRIGAYTLDSLIGQGGMGTVWLARRSDGRFEGQAAVKLLNVSFIGRAAEERFRREGSILAHLTHPHIARLLDAGVSPGGQPYLILEYIEGEPIDRYCDREALDIEQRLRLFLDVLDAVALAHANLIVHRDIKPSNVLVAADGQVKLLDFGIAKLLEGDAAAGEATALTREGGSPLTPEYAAPEQVTGGIITTAADVYSLGTLLYILLSGRHPAQSALFSPVDILRTIVDTVPPRLSDALPPGAPESLRRALKGDLDTIAAKALKKNPAERYSSVTALADDIRRFLDHEPISARPDTLGYRAAKFIRRHRGLLAATAAVFLALAGGLAATVWQAREAARQRDFALTQLMRARGMNEFTAFLLGETAPGGKAVTMQELLGSAERLIDKRFTDDRALGVDLLVAVGQIYNAREETDNAQRAMKRAYETSLTVADPAVRANAACGWARTIAESGDYAAARSLIDTALAQMSEEARFDHIVADCLADRGYIVAIEGDTDATIEAAHKALDRLGRVPGAFPAIRANALQVLAMGYDMRGDTANADRSYAQAMEQFERIGLADTSLAATLLNNWALTRATTDTLGALELQGRAIALLEAGESPEGVPAAILANYGRLLNRLARYAEARPVYERARDDARRHDNLRTVGATSLGLARACRSLGDLDRARGALRDAEGPLRASFPPGHFFLADLTHEQGMLAAAEANAENARRLLSEALAIHEKASEKHVSHIETLLELARLELASGRAAEAEKNARRAAELAEGFRGGIPHSAWVGLSEAALAEIELANGNSAEARRLFGEAAAQMEPTLGKSHPVFLRAREHLAATRSR